MSNMTALAIVKSARQESGLINPGKVIDGFSDTIDHYPDSITWLSASNRSLKRLSETGFNKCKFILPLVQDESEYYITPNFSGIESAWITYQGKIRYLEKTSIIDMDNEMGGQYWRNAKGNLPYRYYMIGTKSVGFYPMPLNVQDLTATFLGTSQVADMVLRTDVPGQMLNEDDQIITLDEEDPLPDGSNVYSALPDAFHEYIAIGAIARILRAIGDDRAKDFFAEFEDGKKALKREVNSRLESDTSMLQFKNPYRSRLNRQGRHFVR